MSAESLALIVAVKARRLAQGFAAKHGDWTGYFTSAEARDEYIARAKRNGIDAEVVAE